jgi:hypothetical protein
MPSGVVGGFVVATTRQRCFGSVERFQVMMKVYWLS